MIEQFYDLRPEVLALDRKALDLCRAQFAHVEEIRDYNPVSYTHLTLPTTAYV